jgi:hypothetical protein
MKPLPLPKKTVRDNQLTICRTSAKALAEFVKKVKAANQNCCLYSSHTPVSFQIPRFPEGYGITAFRYGGDLLTKRVDAKMDT